ncbi:MAG: DUF86 domain-containing protein [Candidatus Pacebacteria bacterium]|nr:DUF86 domain-containing protein [Candidatus Paceibacterota bacterium]
MLNKAFIEQKLDKIKNYYKELEKILEIEDSQIIENTINLRAIERIFQLIVDEMIDINLHLIRELNLSSPQDFQSGFEILAKGKILPYDFARKIAPVVGLRNRLVHRYEEIDRKFFLRQVGEEREDFIKYIRYIEEFLNKK